MKRRLRTVLTLGVLGLLMVRSGAARLAAARALRTSAEVVFPSLFPFFVVSRRLTSALRLRRPERVPMLMGLCGGYPLGVYSACALYAQGVLSEAKALRTLRCCNNTGPAIFFGMIGAVLFPDPVICASLFLVHILSAVVTAALVSGPAETDPPSGMIPPPSAEPLTDSVTQAARACANLCACVVFFGTFLRLTLELPPVQGLLERLPMDRHVSEALLCALADLPGGLQSMARIPAPAVRFVLCAGAVGWGGACVHMQAAGIWQSAGLRPSGYYCAKALQAVVSCALALAPARLLFGTPSPLWPAALPFFALFGKKAIEFSGNLRYNKKEAERRRVRHAVSQKDRARLRLLCPRGEN